MKQNISEILKDLQLDLWKVNRQKIVETILSEEISAENFLLYINSSVERDKIVLTATLDDLVEEKPLYLKNHLDSFLLYCENQSHETIKRCVSRIWVHLLKSKEIHITDEEKNRIIELHFDWLLNNSLVATRANCITILFELRNHVNWIKPELIAIIKQQIPESSIAFESRGMKILKRLTEASK